MRIELTGKTHSRRLRFVAVGEYFMVLLDPKAIYQRVAGENETDAMAVVIDSDGDLDVRTTVMLNLDIPVVRVSAIVIYRAE